MLIAVAALVLATSKPDSSIAAAAADSTHRRIVRQFEPIVVEGGRRSDPNSIESVYTLPARTMRAMPIDRLVDAVALRPGVVATGEDLHVRGGRAGELTVSTLGVPLNDALSGTPMAIPLLAVRSFDLMTGALDADHVGSLAGELDVQTEVPTARPAWMARWVTDGRLYGNYDAGLVRATGPLGRGFGFALAGEARLDDKGLPTNRSRGRQDVLGMSLGWRQDNRLLGWAKLAPVDRPQRGSIEMFATRTVLAPYNAMFAFDGWLTPTPFTNFPFAISDAPVDSTSFAYRAADHVVMTDERRVAVVATRAFENPRHPARASVGWVHSSALTSPDLRKNHDYINDNQGLLWGLYDDTPTDPYLAYDGEMQYYRESHSDRWFGRGDVSMVPGRGQRLKLGGGLQYDDVRLFEIDDVQPSAIAIDSARIYHAWAPGGFAYAQHRWQFAGLTMNTGLRVQMFTPGSHAPQKATWTVSPRLGFAYPVSDKDAFSASYSRIDQDPNRDLLYDNRLVIFNRHPLGSGDLVPAEVISYQAAVKHIFDVSWSLQLAVFYRDIYAQPGVRNEPVNSNDWRGTSLEPVYGSVEDGHAGGSELSATYITTSGQRVDLVYTFMDAWGSQSNADGYGFGPERFVRPTPLSPHPLDWDVRHSASLSTQLHSDEWALSWITRVATGAPWTPITRDNNQRPPPIANQDLINSRRLPWNEQSDLAVRWSAKFLFGARFLLNVTNVFDNRADQVATLSGYPNPEINTLTDDYSAYRTETGEGGGAYYDNVGGAPPGWIPVHDPRLATRARTIRLGIEVGR